MRILLSGSSGLIGRHLVRVLADRGDEVSALVRATTPVVVPSGGKPLQRYPVAPAADDVADAVARARPDLIVHLAALNLSEHRAADVVPLVRSNVEYTALLAEAATAAERPWLVTMGSALQHDECDPRRPTGLYGAVKQAAECVLEAYAATRGLRAAVLKPHLVYGIGDPRRRLMTQLAAAAAAGTRLDLSPGDQLLDLLHVSDAVSGILAAGDWLRGRPGGCVARFGLSGGAPLTLRQLVGRFEAVTGRPVAAAWGARPYRPYEFMARVPLPPAPPGWQPATGIDRGIAELFDEASQAPAPAGLQAGAPA